MFLVETYLARSPIDGTGVFAGQFIAEDALVWRFTPGVDQRWTVRQAKALRFPSDEERDWFRCHAFKSKKSGLIVLCAGNAAYYNWGDDPNTLSVEEEGEDEAVVRALRDIYPGQELTDDYHSFADWSPW